MTYADYVAHAKSRGFQPLSERLALFDQLRLMQLRHWPAGALWVYLTHPQGRARLYRDGSFDLFRAG